MPMEPNLIMQIKSLTDKKVTIECLRNQMLDRSQSTTESEEAHHKVVRKTPKFPSRERHLAIRRRKPTSTPDLSPEHSIKLSHNHDSFESYE